MKKLIWIALSSLILTTTELSAQTTSPDSPEFLKYKNEQIATDYKISSDKLELADLERKFQALSEEAKSAKLKADNSFRESELASQRANTNTSDKKLSSDARSSARKAEKDSKEVIRIATKQEKLLKEISDLKEKIAKAEAERQTFIAAPATVISNEIPVVEQSPQNMEAVPASVAVQQTDPETIKKHQAQPDESSIKSITEKVVESTYRNYPQQPGQPSIIINNIIIPSDYEKMKAVENVPMSSAAERKIVARDPDYEEFRAWKQQRNNPKTNLSPAPAYSATPIQAHPMTFQERFGEKPARKSGLWLIPVVGLNVSDFKADFDDDEATGRTGWNAGLDFRMHTRRFFVQPGVHYFNSSIEFSSKDSLSEARLWDGPRIHSLKVPVMLGLYLTKAQSGFFKFNIKGGATGNYVLAVDKGNVSGFEKDNIEEFSYGLAAGIGIEFGILTIDLSHEWGMSAFIKDSQAKNNMLRATLGLKL